MWQTDVALQIHLTFARKVDLAAIHRSIINNLLTKAGVCGLIPARGLSSPEHKVDTAPMSLTPEGVSDLASHRDLNSTFGRVVPGKYGVIWQNRS